MAQIGTFTSSDDGALTGTIRTLNVNVRRPSGPSPRTTSGAPITGSSPMASNSAQAGERRPRTPAPTTSRSSSTTPPSRPRSTRPWSRVTTASTSSSGPADRHAVPHPGRGTALSPLGLCDDLSFAISVLPNISTIGRAVPIWPPTPSFQCRMFPMIRPRSSREGSHQPVPKTRLTIASAAKAWRAGAAWNRTGTRSAPISLSRSTTVFTQPGRANLFQSTLTRTHGAAIEAQ